MSRYIDKCGVAPKFDPDKDFQKVESGLVVSLSEALRTGVVKESASTLETNGIDDPDRIVGTVKNRFDAIEAERTYRKYGKNAKPADVVTPPVSTNTSEPAAS